MELAKHNQVFRNSQIVVHVQETKSSKRDKQTFEHENYSFLKIRIIFPLHQTFAKSPVILSCAFLCLEAHVHSKEIAGRLDIRTDAKSENHQRVPNQNAGTVSKQRHKRAMPFGWTWALNAYMKRSISKVRQFRDTTKDVNHELKTFCACRAYVTEDKLSGFFNSLFIFIAIHLTSGASIIYCTNITVLTTSITILYYNYIHQKSKLQKNMWDKCNLHTDL